MSEEFDDDAQDIPAAAPKSPLVNPKLIIILVVLVIFSIFCIWVKRKHDQSISSTPKKTMSYAKQRKLAKKELEKTPTTASMLGD